jgi:hypothetical protein
MVPQLRIMEAEEISEGDELPLQIFRVFLEAVGVKVLADHFGKARVRAGLGVLVQDDEWGAE